MSENLPDKIRESLPYATTLVLAFWGGAVKYLQEIKKGEAKFTWLGLTTELLTSGFTGACTYLLCESSEITGPTSGVLIAVSGHMGASALSTIKAFAEKKSL